MYVCPNPKCKKHIKGLETKFVRCPHCGSRILYKDRQPVAKEIKTD